MKSLISLFFVLLLVSVLAENANGSESADEGPRNHLEGAKVLVGIDLLGRVVAAADHDHDGLVEQTYLFTSNHRITDNFSYTIESADVQFVEKWLSIRADDGSFALWVTLGDSNQSPPGYLKRYDDHFVDLSGLALSATTHQDPLKPTFLDLESLDPLDWPINFWNDMLAPGTQSVCQSPLCQNQPVQPSRRPRSTG